MRVTVKVCRDRQKVARDSADSDSQGLMRVRARVTPAGAYRSIPDGAQLPDWCACAAQQYSRPPALTASDEGKYTPHWAQRDMRSDSSRTLRAVCPPGWGAPACGWRGSST